MCEGLGDGVKGEKREVHLGGASLVEVELGIDSRRAGECTELGVNGRGWGRLEGVGVPGFFESG